MDVQRELAEKFYHLPGSTISEKRKSFHDFINQVNGKIFQDNEKRDFIMLLIPRNKLEELFKIDLMLHYQLSQDLIALLKSGNMLYIAKILKNWNFFKETFKNITADTLVNDILPHTSFNSRMKILNRISQNLNDEKLADEFYEAVEEKYGNTSANVLLVCCSMELIKAKVTKYKLKLEHKQLAIILKKNPVFFHYYLDHVGRQSISAGHRNDRKLAKIILNHDEEMFWQISNEFRFYPYFGKHLSKTLLRKNEHLFNNSNDRIHFKSRRIYQELRKNPEKFQKFFLSQLPKDLKDFNLNNFFDHHEISTIINYISKEKRYFFINSIFKEKYGYDFVDKYKLVTDELFSLMPKDIEEKISLARMKENDMFGGVDPDVAIPILIEKLKHTSNKNRRTQYIRELFNMCAKKKDEKHLLDVLKYMEKRHRNDTDVLSNFFGMLQSWPDIELLNDDHWNYIDTIKKLLEMKNVRVYNRLVHQKQKLDSSMSDNYYHKDFASNELRHFDNLVTTINTHFFQEHPKYRKECLYVMKEKIDKTHHIERLRGLQGQFLHSVYKHNTSISSKEHEIPILDYLPLLKEILRYNFNTLKPVVIYYVRFYYSEFNPIIWKFRRGFFKDYQLFRWYLVNHEEELLQNINLLMEIPAIRKNKNFLNRISMYSFRNIPEQITTSCIELLGKYNFSDKIYAINTLSFLSQQEFLKIIPAFYPNENGKFNVEDPPEKLKLQQAIFKCLKKIVNPADALAILRLFCKGDYLKYALQPLYSIAAKVPEKQINAFLNEVHDSPVSVRKHVIHLSGILCSIDYFCVFIKEQTKREKNSSLKSILFQKVLECASVTPIVRFCDLLKVTMHGIDKEDIDAHDALLNVDKVPKEFRAEYVAEAYEILNSIADKDISKKRFQLMEHIPHETYDEIEYHLLEKFMFETMYSKEMPAYWINCVFRTTFKKQMSLFEYALNKFEEHHNSLNLQDKIHADDKDFMYTLCRNFLYFKAPFPMVIRFTSLWFEKFIPELDINCYIFVLFVWIYAKSEYNKDILASNVNEMLQTFLKRFNERLLHLLAEQFRDFLKEIHVNLTQFVGVLLNIHDDISTCLLSTFLLAANVPTDETELLTYTSFLDKLKNHSELCVRTYYNFYLSNLIKPQK